MPRTAVRSLSVLAALGVGLSLPTGSAVADPKGQSFPLTCDGHTYSVVVMGNGEFTPAHDVASTALFIPHAFGPFTGTVQDPAGTVVDTFTDPAVVQGSGKQRNDVTCTYTVTFVSDGTDPNGPPAGFTFVGSGSVTGQRTR